MKISGEFRIRLLDAKHHNSLKTKHAKDLQDPNPLARIRLLESITNQSAESDTGWLKNIVTDTGRRRLIASSWNNMNLFIHGNSAPSNARVNSFQFAYTDTLTNPQVKATAIGTYDLTLLLQSRSVQFDEPLVTRTIRSVGVTNASAITASLGLYEILAFTALTTPIVQGTTQKVDVLHRVTWSLD